MKNIHLRLGGKSPTVLLLGADIDNALRGCLNSCLSDCGQTCSALSRLILPKAMKEIIEKRIVQLLEEYPVGDPKLPESKVGPLASRKQFDKVKSYIQLGLTEGARMLAGEISGRSDRGLLCPTGHLYRCR